MCKSFYCRLPVFSFDLLPGYKQPMTFYKRLIIFLPIPAL
jgi:hypothetical protein